MYKKELDSILKSNKIPRAYLLYDDEFYTSFYGEKIAKQIAAENEIQKYYFDECDPKFLHAQLSQSSLFGGDTIILVKIDKKFDKKTCESLLKAIEANPQNALIIEFHKPNSQSDGDYSRECKAFCANFKGAGIPLSLYADVRFFAPNLTECMTLLRERAIELGLEFASADLRYILELQNNNLSIAMRELEKFCVNANFEKNLARAKNLDSENLNSQNASQNFQNPPPNAAPQNAAQLKRITSQEVRFLTEGIASFDTQELAVAIIEQKPIAGILQTIYEKDGGDDVAVAREMQRFFYQLFLFWAYIKKNGNVNAMEILGYNPPKHIIERQTQYCMKLKESDYTKIFDILNEWIVDIMSGKSRQNFTNLMKIQDLFG